MTRERRRQRREERKYVRIPVRYGTRGPEHKAIAQQISPSGLFVSTNATVFANGSSLMVEITGPSETWLVQGIVRHAIKVHPSMMHIARPGMGIELIKAPPACRAYLASL